MATYELALFLLHRLERVLRVRDQVHEDLHDLVPVDEHRRQLLVAAHDLDAPLRSTPSLTDSAASAISSSVHTSVMPLTFAYDCCAAMIFFMCSRCVMS